MVKRRCAKVNGAAADCRPGSGTVWLEHVSFRVATQQQTHIRSEAYGRGQVGSICGKDLLHQDLGRREEFGTVAQARRRHLAAKSRALARAVPPQSPTLRWQFCGRKWLSDLNCW